MRTAKKSISWAFILLLFTIGCREVALHQDLEETEASEILVLLQQNGIEAKKEREVVGQEASWKVSVSEADVAKARQILVSNNLPRRRELGLSGVYKEKGLIPTPDEQKARFLLALKGEIINSLQKIPGVVDADIVLNVPADNEFDELDPSKKRPTASVVVRTTNDSIVAQTVTEGKLQRFVANTVPNLDANDVAVIVTRSDTGFPAVIGAGAVSANNQRGVRGRAESPPDFFARGESAFGGSEDTALPDRANQLVEVAGIKMDEDSLGRFKAYFVGLLTLLVGVSSFLLLNILRLNRLRLKVQGGLRGDRGTLTGGERSLLGDGGDAIGRPGVVEGTFDVAGNSRERIGR